MSGDYSRFAFDPTLDYHGVQLQQGRPLTDWDWNDATAQINRRQQADSYDTLGQAVVPRTTPDGFAIKVSGSSFTIGPGRMYVDGLLAENHGTGAAAWDAALAEMRGTDWFPYDKQPYLRNAPALPADGKLNLVYLDVWQREVTASEAPDLVEPALGVDTTTRIQTVWQVKVMGGLDNAITCSTPLDQVAGWADLTAPSAGRLSTSTGAPTNSNPCLIPPAAGYKGLENQLYRVEIHDGGGIGKATFKWSRNNASIVAGIVKFIDPKTLVVDSVGKDSVLCFADGDWVEVTDDWRELNNLPGEMHRIVIGGGVDDATRTIKLQTPVNGAWFTGVNGGQPDPSRHTRIKRWDQQGKVLRADGQLYVDLDATGDGLIKVPAAGTKIALEAGILVDFDLAKLAGVTTPSFKSGDYWLFAARAANGSIEQLKQAPPRGIHHHYAKLALTTFNDTPLDCRIFWPPECGEESCACTVCVSPDAHNAGTATIQQAINTVLAKGGGTVCLAPGKFDITETLAISGKAPLRLLGHGKATRLAAKAATVIKVEEADEITLADFAIRLAPAAAGAKIGAIGIDAGIVQALRAERLEIAGDDTSGELPDTAIQLGGRIGLGDISGCVIKTALGIAQAQQDGKVMGFSSTVLRIADNAFSCAIGAVRLPLIDSDFQLQCMDNSVNGGSDAGFRFGGDAKLSGRAEIAGNRLYVTGHGIVATSPRLTIRDNDIQLHALSEGIAKAAAGLPNGIAIGDAQQSGQTGVSELRIFGNRVLGFGGVGIVASVPPGAAMIKANRVEGCGAGILLTVPGKAPISVENNQVADIKGIGPLVLGILVSGAESLQIRDNALSRLGIAASDAVYAAGISALNCDRIAIDGNAIVDMGPPSEFKGAAFGIAVQNPFADAALQGNQIRRSSIGGQPDGMAWCAIAIGGNAPAAAEAPVKGTTELAAPKTDFLKDKAPLLMASDLTRINSALKGLKGFNFKAAAAAAAPYQRAMLRGNQVRGYGGKPLVTVASGNECDFSGNQCAVEGKINDKDQTPEVFIAATALTIQGNRVYGKPAAIDLTTTMTSAAVVGNVTTGVIKLNTAALSSPWKELNILG